MNVRKYVTAGLATVGVVALCGLYGCDKKWAFVVQKGSYDGILIRFHPQRT